VPTAKGFVYSAAMAAPLVVGHRPRTTSGDVTPSGRAPRPYASCDVWQAGLPHPGGSRVDAAFLWRAPLHGRGRWRRQEQRTVVAARIVGVAWRM